MTDHAVVIAGGGPTGMMLAAELALADVDVVVVERRPDSSLDGSRAGGLYPRTMEVLDQRGVVDRFTAAGQPHPVLGYAGGLLEIGDLPTRHPHVLALWQREFEPILASWVEELGVPVLREREVVDLAQDEAGVDVAISDGTTLRASHLVGCDGGRSRVRKAAGIDFPGLEPTTSWLVAEVEMDGAPEMGMRHDRLGSHGIGPTGDETTVRVVLTERELRLDADPGLDELRDGLVSVYGSDFGLRRSRWLSRFTDMTRQAAAYRSGRVLLAGDAAHVHPPHGGQGLNTGVQDAVNLGWKLAQVVHGISPGDLLDTYHAERHPVGARMLRNTMVQVTLARPDDRHVATREAVLELATTDDARRRIVAAVTGLDLQYDLGDGHPLVGRRVPDVDLRTPDGPRRLFSLLHDARPLVLQLAGPAHVDAGPWGDRIRFASASCDGPWVLPVLGEVEPPVALVVRPDGHVAWVGGPSDPALPEVLTRWFGGPGR